MLKRGVAICVFSSFVLCAQNRVPSNTELPSVKASDSLRPASVPAGFVITPFGYFDPSCVQRLAKGEKLLPDGRLQHADGTSTRAAAVCSYPHYTPSGQLASASTAKSPEISGWLENANVTTGTVSTAYGALVATWTVPPAPTANDGQVLFFFPGLEDIDSTSTSILQPVMSWSGGQWAITSWNCCLSGITTSSPGVNVNSGDTIYGSITSTCPAGTVSCATWNVLSVDLTTGDNTILGATPSDGQVFNWAFGGVLEVYYIVSCQDYPPNLGTTFGNLTVFDQNLHPISAPTWTTSVNATVQPQCAYGVDTAANSIKVNYNAGVPATATYEGVNTTTEGNWTGAFGADGLIIANDATLPPSYASVSLAGENPYTWAASSSDVRALQTASGASTRIASTYYAAGNFTINVNLTDGNTHRIALYLLDWDSTARSETISIQDANTLATLSTEVFSGFHNGEYAIWDVSGSVLIRVTKKAGANAVVSGIFFN